jgi:hypothetical protein
MMMSQAARQAHIQHNVSTGNKQGHGRWEGRPLDWLSTSMEAGIECPFQFLAQIEPVSSKHEKKKKEKKKA